MKWETLSSEEQFSALLQETPTFAVFKHSTRCSISSMAKNRLEREWNHDFPVYYLDLIAYRNLSAFIASVSGVTHQSPQLIVFHGGKVIYHASHTAIDVYAIQVESAA